MMVDRSADILAQQLLTWPLADRARLAELLLASLEPSESAVDAAWDVEVRGRIAELDDGRTATVSIEHVLREIDRHLGP